MSDDLRHAFADVDGVRLHWAELGRAGGPHPPLVLIHGLTDSYLSFREVAGILARDRLVLMPDLPGCGLSGRPDASYKLEWHAQIIARWLEQRELASVDVAGHSFGGGVSLMLLLACPERIRRVVLAASGGLGREVSFWLKFAAFPHLVERYGQPFMAFGTRRALSHGRDALHRRDVAALSLMNAEHGTARAFSRTVRGVIDFRGQTRHFLQHAHEVKVFPPIAVFWGERDRLIPIAHGRKFTDHAEGAVFQAFAGCGHYLHQERAADFAAALRGFLDPETATPVKLRAPAAAASAWAWASALRALLESIARSWLPLQQRARSNDALT